MINFKKGIKTVSLKEGIIQVGDFIDETKMVSTFYEKTPFPNYEDLQNKADLQKTLFSNPILSNLRDFIGYKKKIIEVGAGTCQLSLALASSSNNEYVAFDPTYASLKLGKSFAKKNKINNVQFVRGDLFSDPFETETFDFIWCSGVLHHTKSSEKGFDIISKWLKPKGYIIVGLYNSYGRLRTKTRKKLYQSLRSGNFARNIVSKLDPQMRKMSAKPKLDAWFADQYEHPIERCHSIDEVLKWFKNKNIKFKGSVPSCYFGQSFNGIENMNGVKHNFLSRLMTQVGMNFNTLGNEGGLFLMVGQKNDNSN
tara:strand:- start:700 stop:1632 length:933 start_codon:yes stop_codon:yes gene_type:complete